MAEISQVISISPAALFQILKVIKKDGPTETGRLHGMPSINGGPTEVTNACPDFGEERKDIYSKHKGNIKRLNYDTLEVGLYTRNHSGRSLSFYDLNHQYHYQKKYPDYFTLVVVVDEAALFLSIRAFRISANAMNAILGRNDQLVSEYITEETTPENLLDELKVVFSLSPLDNVILKSLLSSFSLLSDIFSLSNFSNMGTQLAAITDSTEKITEQILIQNENIKEIHENKQKQQAYREVLIGENKIRKQRNLQEHSLDAVYEVYPDIPISDKIEALSELYKFKTRTDELKSDLEDESTKIKALISLPQVDNK